MGIRRPIREFLAKKKLVDELKRSYSFKIPTPTAECLSISFATVDAPLVSILIPFHNNESYIRRCLQSVAKHEPKCSFEIVLINDGSTESIDLSDIKGLTIVINDRIVGFTKSVNQAIQEAQGTYIYLLNPAAIVYEGFLDELVAVFETNDKVGAVGSMLLHTNGSLQEAGTVFLKGGQLTQIAKVPTYYPEVNYIYPVDCCSGHSMLFHKKDDQGTLNLLDEQFTPTHFAEADLCFRLKYKQGKNIFYTPFSKVVVDQKISNNATSGYSVKGSLFKKYFETFKQKWTKELAAINAKSASQRILDFSDHPPIIFFHDRMPQHDNNSGELRLTEIMKAYKHLNYQVTLVTTANKIDNPYNEYYQRLGIAVVYAHSMKSDIARYFKEMGYAKPIVWMHSATTFARFHEIVRKTFHTYTLVFDMVDIHHLRHKRAMELFPEDKSAQEDYERYLKIETEASQIADIVIPISDQERQYMRTLCADEKMLVVSNIHYAKVELDDIPSFADREGLLFVGSLHTPNIDAINYLIDEIMPLIWATNATMKLHIVGDVAQCFPPERKNIANVIFHGFVPEITPYFLQQRVMVAPLRYGAGVKGKIGQALEYHLPVVSSSIGTEGMYLVDGKHILVAETAADFAAKTLSLYTNETLWKEIQANSSAGLTPFSKEELYKKIKQIEEQLS